MPDVPTGVSGVGGATPGGAGAPSGGAATGPSPSTQPVPNRGLEAAALAALAVHVQGISRLLAVLPAGGIEARDIREAISKLAKHVPPGAVSQGVQMTEAQRQLFAARQQGPQLASGRPQPMQQAPASPPGSESPTAMPGAA